MGESREPMTRLQLYEDGILIFDRPGNTPPPVPGETCEQFINRMYSQYAQTTPDEGGFNWWVEQCRTGAQSRAQIEAAFLAAYPPAVPPVTPPSGGSDISNQAMLPFVTSEGQVQRFSWRQSAQSSVQLTVIQVSAAAQSGHWSIDGGPWSSTTPAGSDFRFIPIENQQVAAGQHSIDVKITGIQGGSGRFGIQNVGPGVGP